MSIAINLLPDLRQAKLKERRRRQLVTGVSVLIWGICGGVVLLLSLYATGQKLVIAGFTSSIHKQQDELRGMADLPKALTAADHLASLPALYGQRVYFTKFLKVYSEADPTDVVLTNLTVDDQNTLQAKGIGKSYLVVAKLAKALEASNVKVGTGAAAGNEPYFKDISLSNVSAESGGVNFTVTATVQSGAQSGD